METENTIIHSGQTFVGRKDADGWPRWPVAEYLARRKHKPKVAERIRRLNPDGQREGEMPKGIHFTLSEKHCSWQFDCMGKGEFIRQFGRDKWDEVPRRSIYKNGRRQFVYNQAIMEMNLGN